MVLLQKSSFFFSLEFDYLLVLPWPSMQKIVADMRKVLAKNPQVEQQKLHRRVFLDNIDPENQALLVSFDS